MVFKDFYSALFVIFIFSGFSRQIRISFAPAGGTDYVIVIFTSNGTATDVGQCIATGAAFGREIRGDDEVVGCTVAAEPYDACSTMVEAPLHNSSFQCVGGYFAIAYRGNCTFAQKALTAQKASFAGLIVYNFERENYPVEMASDPKYGPDVMIPTFMVGHDCGLALKEKFAFNKGYSVLARVYMSYHDLLRYLVPFVSVVGVCFFVMLAAMVVKVIRDRRRQMRRRLSKKHLRQIPTKRYVRGQDPETCPICLDDFENNDKLRILPCSHAYHCKCIDPWLLKNRRVCPICKRKVLPRRGAATANSSDSETETETTGAGPSGTNERTPLLRDEERSVTVGNSTFYGLCDGPTDSGRGVQLSPASTPEDDRALMDSGVEDGSRELVPQPSTSATTPAGTDDEISRQGFVTASSSLRECYANPNFVAESTSEPPDVTVVSENKNHLSRSHIV